jgi:hypothetical protein
MEQLFEMLKEMKANKEERKADKDFLARIDANMKSYQKKMEANMKIGNKELLATMEADREEWRVGQERLLEVMNAWQEEMAACQGAMETNLREQVDVVDRQKIPNEEGQWPAKRWRHV